MIYAGTGHRPQFLPCKFNEEHQWLIRCLTYLDIWLCDNIQKIEYVITGGAIGWDTWLAERCHKQNIPFHVYVPFKEQGKNWPHAAQQRYEEMLGNAQEIIYIQEQYSKRAFLLRDQKMVDDAEQILALWCPSHKSGGTYHTVCYAESQSKPIINFWKD